jgi:predicted CxxxxCH...CXXCH cytochrome family protein
MLSSSQETVSEEEDEQREACHSSGEDATAAATKEWSRWTSPKNSLGSRGISTWLGRS